MLCRGVFNLAALRLAMAHNRSSWNMRNTVLGLSNELTPLLAAGAFGLPGRWSARRRRCRPC